MNIVDLISGQLSADVLGKLGGLVGASETQTRSATTAAVRIERRARRRTSLRCRPSASRGEDMDKNFSPRGRALKART